jgi:hypothetical protein
LQNVQCFGAFANRLCEVIYERSLTTKGTVLVGGMLGIVLQSKVFDAIDIEISVQRLLSKLGLDG